jgi:hypothetical protein
MMAAPPSDLIGLLAFVFVNYILPYLPTLIVVLLAVGLASWLSSWSRAGGQRRALREELILNSRRGTEILEFVDAQKAGDAYITPIPRFYNDAYNELRGSGNLRTLRRGVREELLIVYSAIDRINAASDRQEDLLAGVPGASPVAADLRAENLRFIRDEVANVVLPRLEQFGTFTSRR